MTTLGDAQRVSAGSLEAALLVVLLAWSPADAWEMTAHREISRQAASVLPSPVREKLETVLYRLEGGTVEPDLNRVDSHKIIFYSVSGGSTWNRAPEPGKPADVALERFAQKAEEMIKAGEPMDQIAFVLGQAAHFIQDLNVPLHVVTGETREQHARYERVAYFTEWPGTAYDYAGFMAVKDYKCFAYQTAKRGKQYVNAALSADPPRAVIETTWNAAVNDTANLWLSIFYRALGPEKAKELYGIPAPWKEIGKGFLC